MSESREKALRTHNHSRRDIPRALAPDAHARTYSPGRLFTSLLHSCPTKHFPVDRTRSRHSRNRTGRARVIILWVGEAPSIYDRRIIEFAFALPEEQRWGDKPKFILRKAMGELLPTSVRERVLKADFSCIFAQALLTESTAAIFQSLSVASMGWVDGGQILTAYQTMARCYSRGDEAYRFHVAPLWMVFGVELWFRTLFQTHHLHPDLPTRQEVVPSYSS